MKMIERKLHALAIGLTLTGFCNSQEDKASALFADAAAVGWELKMSYKGDEDWRGFWFLDGLKATVKPSEDGLFFAAGPVERDDASHAVLWTKQSFVGDLKVQYDYTRLDTVDQCVNIIYLQATGKETGPFEKDISKWRHLRQIPAMSLYFNNMNTLHVSYAAHFMDLDDHSEYVHARRYPVPEGGWFSHTSIGKQQRVDRFLFPGKDYAITILKIGDQLLFSALDKESGEQRSFVWDTSGFDPVNEGRIGLRHMWTRASRYANFRVYERID